MGDHFGAACFLFHAPSRRVLLQHRTEDAPAFPGHWGMFGGGGEPEDDDDPLQAVRRELHEELGLELEPDEIVRLWDYMTPSGSHRYVFLHHWADPEHQFVLGEGQGYGWFTIQEALGTVKLTTNSRRDLGLLDTYLLRRDTGC
jgi:8-oxo-dGTP diphosphatase